MRRKKCILTEDELEECLEYWQGVMGLRDWDISISLSHQQTLPSGWIAKMTFCMMNKIAEIEIPTEGSYYCRIIPDQDMEFSIVHELSLIHI